ncbi:MAG: MFS transporter [Spirochaetales bacterium]
MHDSRRAFHLLFLSILSAGYLASETAVILPALLMNQAFTPSQGGWLISVRFLGGSLSSIVMILLGARVSYRAYLGTAAALVVATSSLLPFAVGYPSLLVISFLRGTALTFLIAPTNGALSVWFSKSPGTWSSRVHSAFGIGLILAPAVGFLVVTVGLAWQAVWIAMGMISIGLLFVARRAPAGREPRGLVAGRVVDQPLAGSATKRGARRLVARFWILPVLIAMFNVGVEGSIIGWVPSYVQLTGGAVWLGQFAGVLLAVGIVFGRALATRLSGRGKLLSVYHGSILAVIALALLLVTAGATRSYSAPLLGVAIAALYPSMIARLYYSCSLTSSTAKGNTVYERGRRLGRRLGRYRITHRGACSRSRSFS